MFKKVSFSTKKLICVFAHPDDEAFGPGGTIAYFTRSGVEVHLVCVTNGDADEKFSKGKLSGKDLGSIRKAELQKSAQILGVKTVTLLSFKDGSLCNNNYHEVATAIKNVVDKIKPDSILTYNLDGVSGHLDHVAVAMESSYVFEKTKYIRNIFYFVQKSVIKKLIGLRYFIYHPKGFSESEVDWVHDISPFYKIKLEAMKSHKSQLRDFFLIKALFGKLLRTELFRITRK